MSMAWRSIRNNMGKKSRLKKDAAHKTDSAPAIAAMSGKQQRAVPAPPEGSGRKETLVCGAILLGLAGAVVWIYLHVGGFGFVYDDFDYIVDNYNVKKGLNPESVAWAFRSVYASNWHPLTWLVHLAAIDLFGMEPAGHHWINVFLHIANTLLLFGLLAKMTGAGYKSAFVAALFAVHPLHVESVAWISELKDVLSAFFGLLTLWAYVRYVAKPCVRRYLPVLFLLALSLMAKPMLVTLPFVLILLDYWPLDRFRPQGDGGISRGEGGTAAPAPGRLLWEKAPLFVLIGLSSLVTMYAQTPSMQPIPLTPRIANALLSYAGYIGNIVWPSGLAALYPYPNVIVLDRLALPVLLLGAVSFFVFHKRERFPFLVTGWLWYLGMLVPVVGLVQVGLQSMADRYTYLSSVGLFVMVVWGLDAATENRPEAKRLLAAGGCAAVVGFAILARMQTAYWRDEITLFTRALAVTERNFVAHNNVGFELWKQKKIDMAIAQYREALSINPAYRDALNNLGKALQAQGKFDEAIDSFKASLRVQPDDCDTFNNLGNALQAQGKLDEAFAYYKAAQDINPHYFQAHNNQGTILGIQGKLDEAVAEFRIALTIRPEDSDALKNLGIALQSQGKLDEAIDRFNAVLRKKPDDCDVLNNLGSALEAQGKLDEAIARFRAALAIDPNLEVARRNLDLALQAKEKQ